MDVHPNPRAVCAIDFGTAMSGFACAFKDNPKNIFNNEFQKGVKAKIRTCVLLYRADEQYHLSCFGNVAFEKLPELDKDNMDVFAFKYFKMELYRQFDETTMLRAHNGIEVPLVDVITLSIKAIVEEAVESLNISTNRKRIDTHEIQWVITVPALWNDRAKQVMRIAAQNAGLDSNLILALEPEAAALYCRKDKPELKFEVGSKYMVVDCGGGTVDIAVHEIDKNGFTQSLSAPVGGPWGARNIDTQFKELLVAIFDCDIEQENHAYFASIMEYFDTRKVSYNFTDPLQITIHGFVAKNLHLVNEQPPYKEHPIEFRNNRLILHHQIMRSFYQAPIAGILQCMNDLLQRLNCTINYILLVGGFSSCPLLLRSVSEEFGDAITVTRPTDPGMAVAVGAVHFGLHPNIISSRCSAYTYGIRVMRKFKEGIHPPETKVQVGNKFYCDNVFLVFVKINQKVSLNYKITKSLTKSYTDNDTGLITIYTSLSDCDEYITPNMQKVGRIQIAVPKEADEGTSFTMIFGGTEIRATAINTTTNTKADCTINFVTKMHMEMLE